MTPSNSDSDFASRTKLVGRKRKAVAPTVDHSYDDLAQPNVSRSDVEDGEIRSDSGQKPTFASSSYSESGSTSSNAETSSMKYRQLAPTNLHNEGSTSRESGEISSSSHESSVHRGASNDKFWRDSPGSFSNDSPDVTSSDDEDSDEIEESSEETESQKFDYNSRMSETQSNHISSSITSADNSSNTEDVDWLSDGSRRSGKSQTRLADLSAEEQLLQYRYFRLSRPDDIPYCLCCGGLGHGRSACPERTCPHCHAFEKHSPNGCPQVQKCSLCRQIGHGERECSSHSFQGSLHCELCLHADHVEDECPRLWSIGLRPNYDHVRQILDEDMYRVCYYCGESGYQAHWGDDCPRYPWGSHRSGASNANKTWTAMHADKYIVNRQHQIASPDIATKVSGSETSNAHNWQHALLDGLLDDTRD